MKMKHLLPGILLSAALASGCSRPQAATPAATQTAVEIRSEDYAVAAVSELEHGPTFSGTLVPSRQATLRAQLAGTVTETLAEAGEPVSKGQLLARLEVAAIREALLSAKSAQADAQQGLELAQREEQRARALAQAGALPARDLENAQHRTVAARATLDRATAQLVTATKQQDYTEIRAPFAGTLSQRRVSRGDVVQPGGELFTLVDLASIELEAAVPAEDLAALQVGVPVRFAVSGYPGRIFAGRISRINPSVDPVTRQLHLYAAIDDPAHTLVGGLFAAGRVVSESRTGIAVPLAALDLHGLNPAITRIKGGRAETVTAVLGLRDQFAGKVEVVSGLSAGDTVLVGAAQHLSAGTPVQAASPRPAL
ncbi:MAG: efflux RND transporter periplasmic adaptor subunit [Candidatus Latescibacteria bacterium]|nr:efflux RND transporter periplasmic adaptor subunit [Candidatus Latescibacterota bacterium]